MAATAVVLSISDMIDLAIGTPEVGVVDFNMLQTLLHCLAQQLRILGKNVELRGSMTTLPVAKDNAQTVTVHEFIYDSDAGKPEVLTPAPPPEPKPEQTLLVVERIKKTDSAEKAAAGPKVPTGVTAPAKTTPSSTAKSAPSHVGSDGGERLSLVTISKFNLLEGVVEDLKNRVYGSMPKNEDILQEVRSQTNLKAITDMWTSLNVSSRLEAAEAGMEKLSSLVQDLIGEMNTMGSALTAGGIEVPKLAAKSTVAAAVSKTATPAKSTTATSAKSTIATTAPSTAEGLSRPSAFAPGMATADDLQEMVEKLRADLDLLTENFYALVDDMQNTTADGAVGTEGGKQGTDSTTAAAEPGAEKSITAAPKTTITRFARGPAAISPRGLGGPDPEVTALHEKIIRLEKEMKKCCDSIAKNEGVIQDQLNSFQDQLEYVSRQVGGVTQDVDAGKLSPDLIKDLQGLLQLFQTVQDMQVQLREVHDTALQLAAEKEDRQYHINALLEQIELLKTIKLDREDMVEALADKADLRMLARKVSHDQFEMACDDLSRGLEHAIGKLGMQEALWQQALDDIQREIESKLDKIELAPVKDFFNNKLKQLQENLKQMAALRKEAEAAGTKRRLLRDVNCISCDAKAIMAMDGPPALPIAKSMPANLSMKPYLSYELDAIRKTQASHLPQRNMHDWETIDKQAKVPPKAKSEPEKHICNRYCGGSHTVTTAAQRVSRLGHFIKQWGPDVLPLSSGFAAGDDGRLYKVSPTEPVPAGPGGSTEVSCTLKSPKKSDAKPPKALIISAECRCLDSEPAPARR